MCHSSTRVSLAILLHGEVTLICFIQPYAVHGSRCTIIIDVLFLYAVQEAPLGGLLYIICIILWTHNIHSADSNWSKPHRAWFTLFTSYLPLPMRCGTYSTLTQYLLWGMHAVHDLQIIPGPHIHAAGHAQYIPQQLLHVISVTGSALAMEDWVPFMTCFCHPPCPHKHKCVYAVCKSSSCHVYMWAWIKYGLLL